MGCERVRRRKKSDLLKTRARRRHQRCLEQRLRHSPTGSSRRRLPRLGWARKGRVRAASRAHTRTRDHAIRSSRSRAFRTSSGPRRGDRARARARVRAARGFAATDRVGAILMRSTVAPLALVVGFQVSREKRTNAALARLVCALRAATRGENMASLSNWSLHGLIHRREIRSIASAFVGEIAALLHLIETHDVVSMLEKALDVPTAQPRFQP